MATISKVSIPTVCHSAAKTNCHNSSQHQVATGDRRRSRGSASTIAASCREGNTSCSVHPSHSSGGPIQLATTIIQLSYGSALFGTGSQNAEWGSQTLRQACYRENPKAQCAFKILMIHEVLQFALRIAFRCVLHRCGNLDIHR